MRGEKADHHEPCGGVHERAKPFEVRPICRRLSSINDGARSAQSGWIASTALSFYLIAISFSTTDLDFLLDRTMQIYHRQRGCVFSAAMIYEGFFKAAVLTWLLPSEFVIMNSLT